MKDSRPFQFSLKAVLGFTAVVAVLAWLVSGVEWARNPYALAYLSIGCGQMLFTVGIWTRLDPAEWQARRGEAFDLACLGFFLSIPTWLVYVAVLIDHRLEILLGSDAFLALVLISLVLQVPGMIINTLTWLLYIRRLRDWSLTALRTLNLANSAILLIVVYETLSPHIR